MRDNEAGWIVLRLFNERIFVLALAVAILPMPILDRAYAQQAHSPSILEFFGFKRAAPQIVEKKAKISYKKNSILKLQGRKKLNNLAQKPQSATISADGANVDNTMQNDGLPLEKMIDAKTILVVGDFMAGNISEGIDSAFAGDAGVTVIEKSNGSSGFVRNDYYSWPQSIAGLIAETKPSVIVVMIGANDRQPLRLNDRNEPVRSPAWTIDYEGRVSQFASTLKSASVPVVWVGLPPFKSTQMSADYLAFNDIYRKAAQITGGTFIDIWEGFVDELGAFTINGSDYTGQPARLRGSDGISLSTAGRRKIAFYAEKAIRSGLGEVAQPLNLVLGPFSLPGPMRPAAPDVATITRLAPISLFDPVFDGDSKLLGGSAQPSNPTPGSAAGALYINGKLPEPKPGRIDDFKVIK